MRANINSATCASPPPTKARQCDAASTSTSVSRIGAGDGLSPLASRASIQYSSVSRLLYDVRLSDRCHTTLFAHVARTSLTTVSSSVVPAAPAARGAKLDEPLLSCNLGHVRGVMVEAPYHKIPAKRGDLRALGRLVEGGSPPSQSLPRWLADYDVGS